MKRRIFPGLGPALLGAAVLIVLSGCGGYYYRASIQGFVIDGETDAGINEAIVRIYTSEVDDPEAEDYVTQTSTVTQGGSAGYYSSTVIWQKLFGAYGQEGDTTTIWIAVIHPDYAPAIFEAEGVLSDEDNLIASVRMSQTTFDRPSLRGRVVDSTGTGVNGVRVVLDLPVVSGADDDPEDSVTQTATIDGESGTFAFAPVEWSDQNTSDPDGEVTATIRVDDPDWGADVSGIASPVAADYWIETDVPLVPGEQERVVPSAIEVYRRPRTEFTATVTGRLVERLFDDGGAFVEDRPVSGVRVRLQYDFQPTAGPLELAYETLVDHTDGNGTYVFTVTWTDLVPGDYDEAGDNDAPDDGSIAAGEDGLVVNLLYDNLAVPDPSAPDPPGTRTLTFSDADGPFDVYSNPRGGVNRLPDVIK